MTTLRVCSTCGEAKPLSEFSRKTARTLQSKCKPCSRAYAKEWYDANREQHIANVHVNTTRQRRSMMRVVGRFLDSAACATCGTALGRPVMMFDVEWGDEHPEYLAHGGYGEERVRAALKAAPVRCANCRLSAPHQGVRTDLRSVRARIGAAAKTGADPKASEP